MSEITGQYADVDGTRIYYEKMGEGPPFFCIYTAGVCFIEHYEFLSLIADQGYRALAVDLPGHEKSCAVGWEPFRETREYSAFTWRIIEEVCNGTPIVMGCSIGGDRVTDIVGHYSDNMEAALALEGAAHTPYVPQC